MNAEPKIFLKNTPLRENWFVFGSLKWQSDPFLRLVADGLDRRTWSPSLLSHNVVSYYPFGQVKPTLVCFTQRSWAKNTFYKSEVILIVSALCIWGIPPRSLKFLFSIDSTWSTHWTKSTPRWLYTPKFLPLYLLMLQRKRDSGKCRAAKYASSMHFLVSAFRTLFSVLELISHNFYLEWNFIFRFDDFGEADELVDELLSHHFLYDVLQIIVISAMQKSNFAFSLLISAFRLLLQPFLVQNWSKLCKISRTGITGIIGNTQGVPILRL